MTATLPKEQHTLPTAFSELVLPYRPSLSETLTSLKKSRLSIHNRLTSVVEDSLFVSAVAAENQLPLAANERCGSWYVVPESKKCSVYFKSTDGHQGQWNFSLRRLNTHLLQILGTHGGVIVIDSTRRGKSMPDALSKTIPIWASVMNRVLFPEAHKYHKLSTPEHVVSRSEHANIESRVANFVKEFQNLELDLTNLRESLRKPIRLEFISRHTLVLKVQQDDDCNTLICCSASRQEQNDGDSYVQGAGDDTENWARGLTSQMFWQHRDQLLNEPNEERLYHLIEELSQDQLDVGTGFASQIQIKGNATSIFIGKASTTNQIDISRFDGVICCDIAVAGILPPNTKGEFKPSLLEMGCSSGKLGGKALREKFPKLDTFLASIRCEIANPKILVLCSTGQDISIGVALAILCRWVKDEGIYSSEPLQGIDKNFIRRRLACITDAMPGVNPSRATLQSVNTYLMGYGI